MLTGAGFWLWQSYFCVRSANNCQVRPCEIECFKEFKEQVESSGFESLLVETFNFIRLPNDIRAKINNSLLINNMGQLYFSDVDAAVPINTLAYSSKVFIGTVVWIYPIEMSDCFWPCTYWYVLLWSITHRPWDLILMDSIKNWQFQSFITSYQVSGFILSTAGTRTPTMGRDFHPVTKNTIVSY